MTTYRVTFHDDQISHRGQQPIEVTATTWTELADVIEEVAREHLNSPSVDVHLDAVVTEAAATLSGVVLADAVTVALVTAEEIR